MCSKRAFGQQADARGENKARARALSTWLKRCRSSMGEVKGETFMRMLEALVESVLLYGTEVGSAVRMVKSSWEAEAQGHSKLDMLQRLLNTGCKLRCVDVISKRVWRIVAKLRGGMAELRVETGRWCGLKREERLCKQCTQQFIENEEYFLLKCWSVMEEREVM